MKYKFENVCEIGKLKNVLKMTPIKKVGWQDLLNGKNLENLILVCEKQQILLSVIARDDTIMFDLKPNIKVPKGYKTKSIKSLKPWRKAIGKEICYLWSMRNQQGYTDGIQFQFNDIKNNENVFVQLIATASKFKVYSLEEIRK